MYPQRPSRSLFAGEIVQHGGLADGRFAPVDGESHRPDRDIHVDVGRTPAGYADPMYLALQQSPS